jgi:hypothetical protein
MFGDGERRDLDRVIARPFGVSARVLELPALKNLVADGEFRGRDLTVRRAGVSSFDPVRTHPGTAIGARLCRRDQPQQRHSAGVLEPA